MAVTKKGASVARLIGCRVVVVLRNGKEVCGTLMAFDGTRDLVLADAERRWVSHNKRPMLEQIGLVLLKGCTVESIMIKKAATAVATARRGTANSKEVAIGSTSGLSKGLRGL